MASNDKRWREGEVFQLMDGSVRVWIDQGVIILKAVELPHLDPVELTESMALQLANVLKEMADQVD